MKNALAWIFVSILCFYASTMAAALWWRYFQFFLKVFDGIEF